MKAGALPRARPWRVQGFSFLVLLSQIPHPDMGQGASRARASQRLRYAKDGGTNSSKSPDVGQRDSTPCSKNIVAFS